MTTVAGTGGLTRLILRRDRFLLPLWVMVLGLLPAVYASATDELYPTAEGRQGYHDSIAGNPSLLSTIGPVFGASVGALTAWRAGMLTLFIGAFSVLTVIRHTRAEEDTGRRELLGSTVCGRHAPLIAALLVTVMGNLVMGAVMVSTLLRYGLPAGGSVAFGLAYAATGCVFAAIGGLAAQLTAGAGAARGIAITVLGASYLLRAVGDSGGTSGDLAWLSWSSPIGWVQRVRPYAGERWWVFGLIVALFVVVVAASLATQARRDVGAGVMASRLGPAAAGAHLSGPLGLAWRLHRGPMLGWSFGFAVMGLIIGGAARSVDQLVGGSAQLSAVIERMGGVATLKDSYLAASAGLLALVAGAYAVQATMRMRGEEAGLRADPVLATGVGRGRWMASHLVFAFLGPAVALVSLGVGMGLTSADSTRGGAEQTLRAVGAAVVQLPAVWILAGAAVALFGLLPRLAGEVAWGLLASFALVSFAGPLLRLDQRLLDLSPYSHIPKVPAAEVAPEPLAWLSVIVTVLVIAGWIGFRRRDVG